MNRLANESSPYLLLHKDNPVDWYPWGDEAMARAKAEDKPICLSIGYASCHWRHVQNAVRQRMCEAVTWSFRPTYRRSVRRFRPCSRSRVKCSFVKVPSQGRPDARALVSPS